MFPIVTELRGWTIGRTLFHSQDHWVAMRYGVTINTNTYDGIIRMILRRP